MGIGVSLFLIAIGAILTWAVDYTAQGIDINAVGVILMVVGVIGLLMSLLFWSSFAPFNRHEVVETDRTVGPHGHDHY